MPAKEPAPTPLLTEMTGRASAAKAKVGDEPVFAYYRSLPQPQRGIAEAVDALAAKTLPGLQRAVKWGMAFYGVGDGWCFSCGGFVGHVKLTFGYGTSLDPVPPITPIGMGKLSRGVDLASLDDLDERQVAEWMKQATAIPGFGGEEPMMLLLAAALALADDPAPSPPAPVAAECFPACSPGYLCHEGSCIDACNPACAPTERCSEERVCVAREAAAPATGVVCAYRERRFAAGALRFTVAVDGRRVAVLANGRYACVDVPAGHHEISLTTPVAGVGANPIGTTVQLDLAAGETASYQAGIGGGMGSPDMLLEPIDDAAAKALQGQLTAAAPP